MNKTYIGVGIVAAVFAVVSLFLLSGSETADVTLSEVETSAAKTSASEQTTSATDTGAESETETAVVSGVVYTLEEVAVHSSEGDCWMAIDGGVYDLTDYIANGFHKPGMDMVISECGTDSSTLFAQEHHGRSAQEAYAELADYGPIGTLAE